MLNQVMRQGRHPGIVPLRHTYAWRRELQQRDAATTFVSVRVVTTQAGPLGDLLPDHWQAAR